MLQPSVAQGRASICPPLLACSASEFAQMQGGDSVLFPFDTDPQCRERAPLKF